MVKYTKQTKEQLMEYLAKHGYSLTEAAKIAGTNRTTLTRYLEKGSIPTEWMTAIRAALKDREKVVCAACGKDISDDETLCVTDDVGLAKLGVEPPKSGWYWSTKFIDDKVPKQKMYRVCPECLKKGCCR